MLSESKITEIEARAKEWNATAQSQVSDKDVPALIAVIREQQQEIERLHGLVRHMEFPVGD